MNTTPNGAVYDQAEATPFKNAVNALDARLARGDLSNGDLVKKLGIGIPEFRDYAREATNMVGLTKKAEAELPLDMIPAAQALQAYTADVMLAGMLIGCELGRSGLAEGVL